MNEMKNKLKGKKVIVTGGAGFIGSHVVDYCVKLEMEVYSIDIKKSDYSNCKACYTNIDISSIAHMFNFFNIIKPDFVVHCAALARIQPSFERPNDYFRINVLGTENVLKMSKSFGVKRVIYSASSSAYGNQNALPFTEEMTLPSQDLNPYASTKRMGEMLMKNLGVMTGGPETVCLRYFNVYGPRQATTADGPYATVIGIFLDQVKQGKPMTVVQDGDQRRDFTHVFDVARANVLAMISPKVGQGEIINIGFGKNHSIFDVCVKVICAKTEISEKKETFLLEERKDFVFIAPRRGEVRATLASISKAEKLLGWKPKISLSEGIKMC